MSSAWQILVMGFGIGLGVAAPIGPVNIEIIRRGLRSGFREPFALGMGAVTADAIYLALVCLGVSRIAEYPVVRITLMVLGVAVLEFLGAMALRDARKVGRAVSLSGLSASNGAPPACPTADDRLTTYPTPNDRLTTYPTSAFRCYTVGMAMMATNPLSMAAWLGFSSLVIDSATANPMAYVWFAISVPAGCASWVVFISSALHFGRRFVNATVLRAVNVLGGLCLCGFGFHLAWKVLAG